MNLQHHLTWLIPSICASVFLSILIWNTTEPLYLKEVGKNLLLGVIVGYFINKFCIINEWQKWISIYCGVGSFLAKPIGLLLLKNKWIILKAKTGLDGDDKNIKE